ncbi:hypothetical protein ACOME3_010402 [Neoechinorhynchus agilis]
MSWMHEQPEMSLIKHPKGVNCNRLSKIIEEKCLEKVNSSSIHDNCIIFEVDKTEERSLVERILNGSYLTVERGQVPAVKGVAKSASQVIQPSPPANHSRRSASRQSYIKQDLNEMSHNHHKSPRVLYLNEYNNLRSLQVSQFERELPRLRQRINNGTHPPQNSSLLQEHAQKFNNGWSLRDRTKDNIDKRKRDSLTLLKKDRPDSIFVRQSINKTNGNFNFHSYDNNIGGNILEPVQSIICVRHGERVDFAFGPNWTERAFNKKTGQYNRVNLNLPCVLPKRANPWKDFIGDSPLTEIGMMQALLTGEALKEKNVPIKWCYSSPSLRCIQTAHYILKGIGIEKSVSIRIEPGLLEFLGWYERGRPNFIPNKELKAFGYNVDLTYSPKLPKEMLNHDEKYIDYYNRSHKVTYYIAEAHALAGGNILLSGHAGTLETCTRQIIGMQPRSYQEFNQVIRKVPFLGLNMIERKKYSNFDKTPTYGPWSFKEPPIPPVQHSQNFAYDWRTIVS